MSGRPSHLLFLLTVLQGSSILEALDDVEQGDGVWTALTAALEGEFRDVSDVAELHFSVAPRQPSTAPPSPLPVAFRLFCSRSESNELIGTAGETQLLRVMVFPSPDSEPAVFRTVPGSGFPFGEGGYSVQGMEGSFSSRGVAAAFHALSMIGQRLRMEANGA